MTHPNVSSEYSIWDRLCTEELQSIREDLEDGLFGEDWRAQTDVQSWIDPIADRIKHENLFGKENEAVNEVLSEDH